MSCMTVLVIHPVCEECGTSGERIYGRVLLEMCPDVNGNTLYMCPACWLYKAFDRGAAPTLSGRAVER